MADALNDHLREELLKQVRSGLPVTHEELADRLALSPPRTIHRLAEALELPRIKVHLYEVAMINGLASADGRIFITRGFYDRFRSGQVTAEKMASVVAHEMGHVALGHAGRRMIDFTGQNDPADRVHIQFGREFRIPGATLPAGSYLFMPGDPVQTMLSRAACQSKVACTPCGPEISMRGRGR